MKYLIVADPQIHNYRQFDKNGSRLKNCIQAVQQCFQIAAERDIQFIICCGDLFEKPGLLPTVVVNSVVDMFNSMADQYPDQTMLGVSGNHDLAGKNLYGKSVTTALSFLQDATTNFRCLDNQVMKIDGQYWVFIPYYTHIEDFEKAVKDCIYGKQDGDDLFLVMHQTPHSFQNKFIPAQISAYASIFDMFTYIFNGHIHKFEQVSSKFVNVGTPLQHTFGESGEDKGILIFDSDTLEYERILFDFPVFEYVEEVKGDNYQRVKPVSLPPSQDTQGYLKTPEDILVTYWVEFGEGDEKLLETGLKIYND